MTRRRRHQVEKMAADLLAEFGVTEPPVDVERIARLRGYRVIFERFPGDLSGTLVRDPTSGVTIGINSFQAPARQRFSIAHEIGHAELHKRVGSDGVLFIDPPGTERMHRDELSSTGDDDSEIEANQYAAALLMPRDFIFQAGQRIVEKDESMGVDVFVEKMATRFNASEQAIRLRLVNLGIVEPS